MTKLQLLHRALNERLMAAVEQIMQMVGGTVQEYEEETIRARKENEILRRRLRWMEGEIHTDWPGLTQPNGFSIQFEIDTSGNVQPVDLPDEPAFESLVIKTEPSDPFEYQSVRPDVSLTASVRTADGETVDLETSEPPDGVLWNMANSYMAPLDFEPAPAGRLKGKGRSQRMSFACTDKTNKRTQQLSKPAKCNAKEKVAEDSGAQTLKKIHACPFCDKVFARAGWLLPHIRSHTDKISQKSDLRQGSFLDSGQEVTEEPEMSQIVFEQPTTGILEPNNTSLDSARDSESNMSCNEFETNLDQSNDFRAKSKRISEKSTAAVITKSKTTCKECGKVYLNGGWLKTHMKIHEMERMDKETRLIEEKKIHEKRMMCIKRIRQRKMRKELRKTQRRKNLLEKKRILKEKKLLEKEHGFGNTGKTVDQDTNEMPLQVSGGVEQQVTEEQSEMGFEQPTREISEPNKTILQATVDSESEMSCNEFETNMDQSNDFRDESERNPEESTTVVITNPKKTCQECGKVYLNDGCLKAHMKIHEMERMDTETRLNEEKKIHETRQEKMMEELRKKQGRQSLLEKKMMIHKENKLLEKEHGFGNTGKTVDQDTNEMPLQVSDVVEQQVTEEPEMGFEQPTREISQPNKTILQATVDSESEMSCNEFETNMDQSNEIRDESERNPEESTTVVITNPKKTCQECGKVYLNGGYLKYHMKIHELERMDTETRLIEEKKIHEEKMMRIEKLRQQKMMEELRKKQRQQIILEKKMMILKENELLKKKHGFDTIGPREISEPNKTINPKESTAAVVKKSLTICQECGKVYLCFGHLKNHMRIHKREKRDREMRLLEEKRKEEKMMRKEKKRELKLMKELKRKQRMAERQKLAKKKKESELPKKKDELVEQITEDFEKN